jgi:uncharacterized membrane protein YphA (DoxX/SURF4 family)
MDDSDLRITSPAIGITARILFTLIFFLSGVTHITAMHSYIDLMPAAIPWRGFWVLISAVVELLGAAMVLFNYHPRLGGWLLVLFLVPVTIVVHGTAMLSLCRSGDACGECLDVSKGPRDDRVRAVHYPVRRSICSGTCGLRRSAIAR